MRFLTFLYRKQSVAQNDAKHTNKHNKPKGEEGILHEHVIPAHNRKTSCQDKYDWQ